MYSLPQCASPVVRQKTGEHLGFGGGKQGVQLVMASLQPGVEGPHKPGSFSQGLCHSPLVQVA